MRTLDRTRPYGEVFGAGPARFEQDHVLFDAQGHALTEPAEPAEPEKKRARKPAEPVEPTATDAQLDAQLQG
ncbi:hypothetical protein [Aromatoleum anaerobium]|uniref:Uncharacterized protein n=1 Tax=Aromatoleum anaerobium TaxID=182180 RepID=A0ABX1PRV1_9RHOO|nr:hypothetical protein [Aromatoleum anaerobium]MCK0507908.1 hypothetical protein [Aromatoleum anaerobium]